MIESSMITADATEERIRRFGTNNRFWLLVGILTSIGVEGTNILGPSTI